jgi:hypothetical protein
MPNATMAGISRQPVDRVRNKMRPTASHMTETNAKNPELDGRRPTLTGGSGFGAGPLVAFGPPPFGVTRPLKPGLRWRVAMDGNVSGRRLRRSR